MSTVLPRLVVAAPASGHGKTTIATGLMAALARTGLKVSGHKVGPDYIDPGYHALATGLPGRNLDPHLLGEERLVPLLQHGAAGADLAVVEGVMGLHDGMLGTDGYASTAHVARATDSPVVLVVDVSSASRSIAALVQGMVAFDTSVRVAGVVLNKVGSTRHADEVVRALESTGVPVLGIVHRDDGVVAPSRHLGLVPAAERDDAAAALDRLATRVAKAVDLEEVVRIARSAPTLQGAAWDAADEVGPPPAGPRRVVAVAGGRSFTFRYAETVELLDALGCDVRVFDPLHDESLPEGTSGLYLGGGFPEVHAATISANEPLRHAIADAVAAGVPTVAECAGLLYLCRSLDGAPMVGALPADAAMTPRLTLGYRTAVAPGEHLLAPVGGRVTGHEFHRTHVTPSSGADDAFGVAWTSAHGEAGFASPTLHASYLHTHWAGHPRMAARFAAAVHAAPRWSSSPDGERQRARPDVSRPPGSGCSTSEDLPAGRVADAGEGRASRGRIETTRQRFSATDPLRHHGDVEATEGLVDLAVNVHDGPRPTWLDDALRSALDDVGRYPDAREAEAAAARRHVRPADEVLATAGAAEAFTLLARARDWQHPVVVHPQFTEPDVALRQAGHDPQHVRLGHDFALEPDRVPDDADLVVVGNPTNPTGVLHPAWAIRALARPGRVVVVDEAFMDAVPGEQHSFAGAPAGVPGRGRQTGTALPGVLVVRSLTKLWSIPGVRAGYVLGDPDLLADLRAQQPPWSVSTHAAAAIVACTSDDARAEATRRAADVGRNRAVLTDGLDELGVHHLPSSAPFVLARVGPGVHGALRDAGWAVRRADTFPGLDDAWIRVAVRAPDVTRRFLAALAQVRS
ncbi:cobyrinate a,c-diamide synthase [Aeromicrobium sp. 50.2.37]|uniref:cobyrinate a,c-diamide synthase n=1 Tax=Aeromicrobium sp. 50.2.37 TaxID=2969305 RepID=UPI00214FD7D5|nr:cobyrinate a,c-diamide synthase [Aeromicrobium sp. 50.2.37]MCR4515008.1 cobyrinate a,c-diamide synthase [Aeromicrobium sp. 50.2.37]